MKSRRVIGVGAAVVGATAVLVGPASATPPQGEVVRTDLAKGTTNTPVSIVTHGEETAFYVQSIVLKPASSSGWHAHPGPEYTVVTKGTVQIQMANNCPPIPFGAGQAVFIPAGVPHVVRNFGPDEANAVVTYTVPADLAVRDDLPAACP
jgi:quercetin dioxygenase-like cupin family protein